MVGFKYRCIKNYKDVKDIKVGNYYRAIWAGTFWLVECDNNDVVGMEEGSIDKDDYREYKEE